MDYNKVGNMTNTNGNTKDRIVLAGSKLFASNSYDGTTTRIIAEEAKVNVTSIAFYFGNKEGLYKEGLNRATEAMLDYFTHFVGKIARELNESSEEENKEAVIYMKKFAVKAIDSIVDLSQSQKGES